MKRRTFLGASSLIGAAGLAGCTGLFNIKQRAFAAPPLVKNRPNAVYYPTHIEKMRIVGVQKQSGYTCALTYTYPHRFWLITGTHTREVKIKQKDSIHIMPIIWDTKSGQILPDVQPKVQVSQSGKQVLSDSPWPMLSQPMGWHFGDNIQLPKDGTYKVTIHVGAPSAKRTGSLRNAPKNVSFSFNFKYSRETLEQIPWHKLPKKKGKRGAVPHMKTKKIPPTAVPKKSALPGTVVGEGKSGDAKFVVSVLNDASQFGGSSKQSYLVVSPRSPYNRYMLPMMSLSLTQKRGSTIVTKTNLTETLDPKVNLHYGAPLGSVKSGDKLTIHVNTPPQFARHEGYETAFIKMPDITVTA